MSRAVINGSIDPNSRAIVSKRIAPQTAVTKIRHCAYAHKNVECLKMARHILVQMEKHTWTVRTGSGDSNRLGFVVRIRVKGGFFEHDEWTKYYVYLQPDGFIREIKDRSTDIEIQTEASISEGGLRA
jgi:hypothetical protein